MTKSSESPAAKKPSNKDVVKTDEQNQGGMLMDANPPAKCKKTGKSPRKHKKKSHSGKKKSHKKKSKHQRRIINIQVTKSPNQPQQQPLPQQQQPTPQTTPEHKPKSDKKHKKKHKKKSSSSSSSSSSSKKTPQKQPSNAGQKQEGFFYCPGLGPVPLNAAGGPALQPNQQVLSPNVAAAENPCVAGCQCGKCVANQEGGAAEECKCEDCVVKNSPEPPVQCPADCKCEECAKKPTPHPRAMINEWVGFHVGATFPKARCVQAMGRALNTFPGEAPEQFVGMAQIHGEAVMGRIWKDKNGKIAANFSRNGIEYKERLGEIQLLLENSDAIRGFDYGWQDFKEVTKQDNHEWIPLHIKNVAPCVLTIDGKELLGKVDLRDERGVVCYNGEEKVVLGDGIATSKVLCRKAKPGYVLK